MTSFKSEVKPAVHHSRPQARNGIQMLTHMLSEATKGGRARDAPVRPGGVVVVCDYPVCWAVSLKHKHFPLKQPQRLTSLIDCRYGQCTQKSAAAV